VLVSDVMHAGGVEAIDRNETLVHAAEALRAHGISSLAVIEDGRLVGIVTERDIVAKVADGSDAGTTTAAQAMTDAPVTVEPATELRAAAQIMAERGIRHLPVVEGSDLVGMLSVRDLLGWAMGQIDGTPDLWPDLMVAIATEWPH